MSDAFDPLQVGSLPVLQPLAGSVSAYTLAPYGLTEDSAGYNVSPSFVMRNIGSMLRSTPGEPPRCAFTGTPIAEYAVLSATESDPMLTGDAGTAMMFRFVLMPTSDLALANIVQTPPFPASGWGPYVLQLQAKARTEKTWSWVNYTGREKASYGTNVPFILNDTLDNGQQPSRWGLVMAAPSNVQDLAALPAGVPLQSGAVLLLFQSLSTEIGNSNMGAAINTALKLVNVSAAKRNLAGTFKGSDGLKYPYFGLFAPTAIEGPAGGNCQVAAIAQNCSGVCASLQTAPSQDTPGSGNTYFTYDLWVLETVYVGQQTDLSNHAYVYGRPPPLIAVVTPPPASGGGGGHVAPAPAAGGGGGGGGKVVPAPAPPPPAPPAQKKSGLSTLAIVGIVVAAVVVLVVVIVAAAVGAKNHRKTQSAPGAKKPSTAAGGKHAPRFTFY